MLKNICSSEDFKHVSVSDGAHVVRFSKNDDGSSVTFFEEIFNHEPTLSEVIQLRQQELKEFDSSKEINEFFLNGRSMWLSRELRETLERRLKNEIRWGHNTITISYEDEIITLSIKQAEIILDKLEQYATDCYDTTANHRININRLESAIDVLVYDIHTGYPKKLHFNTPAE